MIVQLIKGGVYIDGVYLGRAKHLRFTIDEPHDPPPENALVGGRIDIELEPVSSYAVETDEPELDHP